MPRPRGAAIQALVLSGVLWHSRFHTAQEPRLKATEPELYAHPGPHNAALQLKTVNSYDNPVLALAHQHALPTQGSARYRKCGTHALCNTGFWYVRNGYE